ncbi:helix-turn-helix domain-containing protein [Pedobacter hartonius]|uniref:Helix-turn-helix domain-containing protein n=1 Tax=Pedobacter hartonius TaxID=425514 RepID=A0A1H4B9F8_9SPHI|nr:helix-turn-helix domain-containing protein [Pedobacter hartonius]SEA44706.1 Helix-turn-helix domain-containing protein [Pedobacter hartonius]
MSFAFTKAISISDSLYQIVKHFSGRSPKEFIISRLILEARRRIYYGEQTTVKELAFELGFNYPDYFCRLAGYIMGSSSEPLQNPWHLHADGSLARHLGFRPTVRTVYQAVQENLL